MNQGVNLKEIPNYEMKYLAQATLRAVERFFESPDVKVKYQAWLTEYKKKKETQEIRDCGITAN